MNIFFLGYMASGKSTIAKALSKSLQFEFLDLDAFIEEKERCSISEIFKNKGEIHFRKLEHFYLKQILSFENTVVALGGGTPCYANNMQLLKEAPNAKTIFLKAKIATLVDRLMKEKNSRPLVSHINQKEDMIEFVGKHLFERTRFYEQSDLTLSIDELSITEIVEQIKKELF